MTVPLDHLHAALQAASYCDGTFHWSPAGGTIAVNPDHGDREVRLYVVTALEEAHRRGFVDEQWRLTGEGAAMLERTLDSYGPSRWGRALAPIDDWYVLSTIYFRGEDEPPVTLKDLLRDPSSDEDGDAPVLDRLVADGLIYMLEEGLSEPLHRYYPQVPVPFRYPERVTVWLTQAGADATAAQVGA